MKRLRCSHYTPVSAAMTALLAAPPSCATAGMNVVSLQEAQQMVADGRFLYHQEVLGHLYGVTASSVRKVQALGKLPLLDLDRVQDVEALKAAGLQVGWLACGLLLTAAGTSACSLCLQAQLVLQVACQVGGLRVSIALKFSTVHSNQMTCHDLALDCCRPLSSTCSPTLWLSCKRASQPSSWPTLPCTTSLRRQLRQQQRRPRQRQLQRQPSLACLMQPLSTTRRWGMVVCGEQTMQHTL